MKRCPSTRSPRTATKQLPAATRRESSVRPPTLAGRCPGPAARAAPRAASPGAPRAGRRRSSRQRPGAVRPAAAAVDDRRPGDRRGRQLQAAGVPRAERRPRAPASGARRSPAPPTATSTSSAPRSGQRLAQALPGEIRHQRLPVLRQSGGRLRRRLPLGVPSGGSHDLDARARPRSARTSRCRRTWPRHRREDRGRRLGAPDHGLGLVQQGQDHQPGGIEGTNPMNESTPGLRE